MLRGYASVWWLQRLGRSRLFTKQKLSTSQQPKKPVPPVRKMREPVLPPTVERCVLQNQFQVLTGKRLCWAHQPSRRDDHLRPEHIPWTCGAVLSIVRFKNIPSGTGAKRPRIRYETQRIRYGFTRFSMAPYRSPRVLPAFVCLAMCPSAARSRDGNRPAPVASRSGSASVRLRTSRNHRRSH